MAFLTNYKFWIIFAVLLILLAIVGYLAENTGIIKKKQEAKKPEKENEKVKEVVQDVAYTPLVEVDSPIETLNVDDNWTDESKKDDKHEQSYQVPSDDWMNLPDMNKTK